jgi:hypothetical protein
MSTRKLVRNSLPARRNEEKESAAMNRISTAIISLLTGIAVVATSGCAQVTHKIDVLYTPQATYRGGTGSLDLATVDSARDSRSEPSIRWVLGQIKNTEGGVTGEIISSIRSQDIITDAFKQELTAAGYQTNFSKVLDNNTRKGVFFTDISVQLEEIPSFAKLESSCTILLKMDLWKNGTIVKRTEYRSKVSDVAVIDRDQLAPKLYQKAIHDTMQQAVPDIIRLLN